MTTNRITVGIDQSQSATTAVSWAADLAASIQAPLQAIHAWQMPLIARLPDWVEGLPTPEFMNEQSATLIDKVLGEAGLDPVRISAATEELPPGQAIANETAPDAIVVTGRTGDGKSRFARLVLGSTTHYAVHHANGPIAVVPDHSQWVPQPHVVVGVDGSEPSLAALAWAIGTMPAEAIIEARHVVAPWGDPYAWGDRTLPEKMEALLLLELSKWTDRAKLQSSRPERHVRSKIAVGEARWALAPSPADSDIVIIGHRGRNPIAERALGSVADHLIRKSAVPVVVHRTTHRA